MKALQLISDERINDKARGCIVGGAIGDALGYPVEFIPSFEEIALRYGDDGISEFDLGFGNLYGHHGPSAIFSDDTQMTLYTMEGIAESIIHGLPLIPTVCNAYLAWWSGQIEKRVKISYESNLRHIVELNQRRAPGTTCMSALQAIHNGKEPANNSKGCGGVMRVAPFGLYGAVKDLDPAETGHIAGEAADLTHLHPLSTYSSAMLAILIQFSITRNDMDLDIFRQILSESLETVEKIYGNDAPHMDQFRAIIRKANTLASNELRDWEIIENGLGGGWVAEEALAISIFSVLRHFHNIEACLLCAVNHGGDSDSTGAITGNIIGAIYGYDSLPDKFKGELQLLDVLLEQTGRFLQALRM